MFGSERASWSERVGSTKNVALLACLRMLWLAICEQTEAIRKAGCLISMMA